MMQECLIWEKPAKTHGYGQTFVDGRIQRPHRVAWEALYGEIPAGKVIDHTCHNEAAAKGECEGGNCIHKLCYNPNHLRLVTQSENTLAGLHSIDVKATCPQGHDYQNPDNIMIRANGKRECAECNRVRSKNNWLKKKVS